MKKYFLFLAIVLIPSILLAWTEPTGSTFTVSSGQSQEIKDIQNDIHDVTNSAWRVIDLSTGPTNGCVWVWDSDFNEWVELTVSSANVDGVSVNTRAQTNKVFLYGFNRTSWDRLTVDELKNLYVRTSSNSIILNILNPVTNYMTLSQYDGIIDQFVLQYVLSSTNTANVLTELIKHYVLSSTNTAVILDEFIKHYVLSSTNTATIMTELIKAYVLTSTGTDGIIARLDGLLNGVTTYLTESQLKSLKEDTTTWVTNMPSDFPDSISQSSLSNIDTNTENIYEQSKSSIMVSYKVDDSTYVCRDFYGNGTLTVNFNVKSIGFYSLGGDTNLSWDGGDTVPIWEGIPFNDVPIDEAFDNPVVFTFTLTSPTTFTIYARGRL